MKKIIFFSISIILLSVNANADPWTVIREGKWCPIYQDNIRIKRVVVIKELIHQGNAYYQYAIQINRPKSVLWGSTNYGFPVKICYWVSDINTNPYFAIKKIGGPESSENGNVVNLYTMKMYRPSRNEIILKVGAFPYPYGAIGIEDSLSPDFNNDWVKVYSSLIKRYPDFYRKIWGENENISIGEVMNKILEEYAAYVKIEVYSNMVNINGMDVKKAANELKKRNLNLVVKKYVNTQQRFSDNKIKNILSMPTPMDTVRIRSGSNIYVSVYRYVKNNDNLPQEKKPSLYSLAGVWKFGRANTDEFLGYLNLTTRRGKYGYVIGGPHHPNESYWQPYSKDVIIFYHAKGYKTTVFRRYGPKLFRGRFIPPPGWKSNRITIHYLKR